jgi:hypothetical protein
MVASAKESLPGIPAYTNASRGVYILRSNKHATGNSRNIFCVFEILPRLGGNQTEGGQSERPAYIQRT